MGNNVIAARALMADSLGFHIIFALLGVGLPVVLLLIEQLGMQQKDPLILEHAKRLSLASIILVVAGVASGTIISIQMTLMWGNLITFGGPILGLAFGWEGYAFMLESVFLAFYVTSWGKIKGWKHWLIGVPVAIGSLSSAFAITLGNAWMQNPGKLTIVHGKVVSYDPLAALLSKTAYFMSAHSIMGYYLTTVLTVLGVYAFYFLKFKPEDKDRNAVKKIMFRLAATALVLIAFTAFLGDVQTKYLAQSEPRKFAVLESVQRTGTHMPFIFGGTIEKNGTVVGGLRIPDGLSILTNYSPDTRVIGLDAFPRKDWPMLFINTLFDSKLVIIGLITLVPFIFVVLHWKRFPKHIRHLRYSSLMLWTLLPMGFLATIIVELGWMIAEFGRQPFAVNGYLRTDQAFSASQSVEKWGYLFPSLYVFLFIATGWALLLLFKRKGKIQPAEELLS